MSWEEILASLGDDQRAAYEAHVAALKNALDREREAASSSKSALAALKSEKSALQAELTSAKELAETAKTEADEVKTALSQKEAALSDLSASLETQQKTFKEERAKAAILAAAKTANFEDPSDALLFISVSALENPEDESAIKVVVDALAATKKHLLRRGSGVPDVPELEGREELKFTGLIPTI